MFRHTEKTIALMFYYIHIEIENIVYFIPQPSVDD